jgi:cadmium resistance protein CadD (predicted permease)
LTLLPLFLLIRLSLLRWSEEEEKKKEEEEEEEEEASSGFFRLSA